MAASASGGRDWYAALPLPWRTDSLGYVLRSIGAAALALGLGLYLQLDSPFSAASTVLLLINPVQGAVVGKGWWRAVGTLVGTLAAFVLTALFAQKMLLFVVALGFWLGLCVGVMSLVRHFYATAAVVAGYTVCLALGPAMVEPEAAFEHIVTRASAVIVGVCLPEPGDRALQPQDRVRAGAPASRLALRGDAGAGRCAACRCG